MAVSTFHRITLAAQLLEVGEDGLLQNKSRSLNQLIASVCFSVVTVSLSAYFFAWLGDEKLSFIPVLCIIFFGISMSLLVFFYLRYQAAVQLTKNHPKKETAQKLLSSRLAILPARRSRKSYISKLASHKRRLSASNYELTTPNNIKEDAKVESVGNTESRTPWWIREVKVKFNLLYFTLAHTSGKRDENKRFIYFGPRRVSQCT